MEAARDREEFIRNFNKLNEAFEALPPELEVTVRDPELGVEGYVVVWSTLAAKQSPLGRCGKGGTRITPSVSLAEVGRLAKTMTLKNAGAGLPLGGAKSGLRADPSAPNFERTYRRFVQLIKPFLVENGGIFGGLGFDLGGRPEHALWAVDELKSGRGFTGKPKHLGGTDYDREGIAGLGVAAAAEALTKTRGWAFDNLRFSVQGLGAMGAAVIRYFSPTGAKLQWISDPRIGGSYELPSSIPGALLDALSNQRLDEVSGLLKSLSLKPAAVDDVLFAETDILFPCAVQDVIHESNVARVRAKAVVEGANGPCTETARTSLYGRKVEVIPDFIANPGGIIAAFVEMGSDLSGKGQTIDVEANVKKAKAFTRERIEANIQKLVDLVDRFSVEPVVAGRYLALSNILK